MDGDLALLAGRMAITAAIVVTASLVAERAGSFLGAMVATLPLSVGPAYVFLARDHGPDFVAATALASLVGGVGITAFVLAYVAAASRLWSTPACIACALGAWAACVALLRLGHLGAPEGLALYLATSLAGIALTGRARRSAAALRVAAEPWHLAVRAVAVMALVGLVLTIGRLIGPEAAGSIALVPIVFTSLILILQPVAGPEAVTGLLAHGLVGMLSYGPAFAIIRATAVPLGSPAALSLALATCIGWSAVLILWRRRRRA